jgi:putative acetyltransferase
MAANFKVVVRDYRADDLDTLMALFRSSVREIAGRDYSPEQTAAWAPEAGDRERWTIKLAGRPTLVAMIGEEIAGFSDLEPDGHIDMMFVHPRHAGRGAAGALMREIERRARAQGLARLFTEASLTARPFFERHGFSVIAAQNVEVRGQTLRNFRMERRL